MGKLTNTVVGMDESMYKSSKDAPIDPWKHRSKKMSCATCMWSILKEPALIGRCRRHAPTMSGYPAVYPEDWCGDHKIDENKI